MVRSLAQPSLLFGVAVLLLLPLRRLLTAIAEC
jgi:hypothetical protein